MAAPAIGMVDSNADLLLRVESCVELILGRKEFKNMKQRSALGVQHGGTGAAFDKGQYDIAIATCSTYSCRINLSWLDFRFTAMGGVPIREAAVDELQKTIYGASDKVRYPGTIEVAVSEPETFDPEAAKGALLRVSPPEELFAFIFRMAADIERSEDNSHTYKQACLDIPATFIVLRSRMDMWWHE